MRMQFMTSLPLVLGLAAAACSGHEAGDPRVAEATDAIVAPGLTPVPNGWQGNAVDLMVADAFASCSWKSESEAVELSTVKSIYASTVRGLMQASACTKSNGQQYLPTYEGWFNQRQDPECNKDPGSGTPASVPLEKHPIDISIRSGGVNPSWLKPAVDPWPAEAILRAPATYLCVAQQLRNQAPGTAGAEAMLLTAAEQRQLLEVTRELTQGSVLGYAQLALAFTETDPGDLTGSGFVWDPDAPIPVLTKWGQHGDSGQTLRQMSEDFAAAVQLHAIVTHDVAELYGRSASAREPRSGTWSSLAEEIWGPGSFRQRAQAVLYGGDPRAAEFPVVQFEAWNTAVPWPRRKELPFVSIDLNQPEVPRLLALAAARDLVDVKVSGASDGDGCRTVQRQPTADQLYRAVEANLRTAACANPDPMGACPTITVADIPDPAQGYEEFLLWREHRITPEHAALAAEYLAQLLEPACYYPQGGFGAGARNLVGTLAMETPAGQSGEWYHISNDASFVERGPLEIQPIFGRYARFNMPSELLPWATAAHQGFTSSTLQGANVSDESKRLLGGVATLVATREALLTAIQRVTNPYYPVPGYVSSEFLALRNQMLGTIGGAIGTTSYSVKPSLTSAATELNPDQPVTVYQNPSDGSYHFEVDIVVPQDDAWWSDSNFNYHVVAVMNDPVSGALFSHPEASLFGKTAATITQSAQLEPMPASVSPYGTGLRRFLASIDVPSGSPKFVTVAVRRLHQGQYEYRLLGANLYIDPSETFQGFHMGGGGGSLGGYAERLFKKNDGNLSQPAFDGFGYPTTMTPPADPALVGAPQGVDPAVHYVQRARDEALTASEATKQAFESLLIQQSDEAEMAAANERSQRVLELELEAICGADNPSCDFSMFKGKLFLPSQLGVPACTLGLSGPSSKATLAGLDDATPSASEVNALVDCIVGSVVRPAFEEYTVPSAVLAHIDDPQIPNFSSYEGGILQPLFVRQMGDIRRLRESVADVMNSLIGVRKHVDAYVQTMSAAAEDVRKNCSSARMAEAVASSFSASASISFGGPSVGVSFSPGPIIAQAQKCEDLSAGLAAEQAQATAQFWSAVVALGGQASTVSEAGRMLREDSAQIQYEMQNAERTQAQVQLEADLLARTQLTGFGLYRRYHSFDLWRAKAATESARRALSVARRMIESRFVVEMSGMNVDEPFVAAPSLWADEVYGYDLSLPAAVGLSLGEEGSSGVYPNKLLDYAENLQRFIDGFSIARPSASHHEDAEVMSLPGPGAALHPLPGGGSPASDAELRAWSFFCPSGSGGDWVDLPSDPVEPDYQDPDQACGGAKPTRARVVFSLDPWGRPNTYVAETPPSKRYNVRWDKLAVNLVGTGVKDCTLAENPLECYSTAFVRYDLSHVGPSWVTNHSGSWRAIEIPTGWIEQAKALAAEQLLDPIGNGFSQAYVQAVARQELTDRPFDGVYALDLEVGPEVELGRIQQIQLLTSSSYWVKQE